MAAVPVVVEQDAGEYIWFGGALFTFKVTAEQSNGAFILIEDTASRGKTTPLHVHPHHDETFYVVEGELILHVDGDEQIARSGSIAFVPRGVPHAFLVTSESARFLGMITPGDANAEAFFRQAGEAAPDRVAPPAGTPLDIARIVEAGKRTGFMEALGPPPFERDESRVASA